MTTFLAYLKPWGQRLSIFPWRKILNWFFGIGFLIVIGVMALFVWQNRLLLVEVMRTAQYVYFLWAFIVYALSLLVVAFGWHLIMRDLDSQPDLSLNMKIYLYTHVVRRLPGTVWYIAGRALFYEKYDVAKRITSLASGIEMVLSILSGFLVGTPALFWYLGYTPGSLIILGLIGLMGLGALHPKILAHILNRLGHEIQPDHITFIKILAWLSTYAIMWVGGGVLTYTVIAAIYPLPSTHIPLIISLSALNGGLAFFTLFLPNNLGFSEVTLSVLLSQLMPWSIAILVAILLRLLTTAFDVVLGGPLFWIALRDINRK